MKLQILINHYHEGKELIGRLLTSIQAQTGVDPARDVGVIIASDGDENPLEKAFLDSFPFPVRYFILPHSGTRATRNALLDMAEADYVMFCDADDCFYRPDGLSALLGAAYCGADVVSAPFEEELFDGEKYSYVKVPHNVVWIHGKIFRRGYLTDNNIRFDDVENPHGEHYFLWAAFRMSKNVRYLSECSYVWKWNPESVTRKSPFYNVRNYSSVLASYSRLADNLRSRGRSDLYRLLIADMITIAYVDCHSKQWDDAPYKYVRAAKDGIREILIRRYGADYMALDVGLRKSAYKANCDTRRVTPTNGFDGIEAWIEKA